MFSKTKDPGRYLNWADVIILVYSVTSKDSLERVGKLLDNWAEGRHRSPPVIVVGNKNDLEIYRSDLTQ